MSEQDRDPQSQVEVYRKLVLEYEALDEEIDSLIMAHDGHAENMSPENMDRYRVLAEKRTDVLNQMRLLEQELFTDEE